MKLAWVAAVLVGCGNDKPAPPPPPPPVAPVAVDAAAPVASTGAPAGTPARLALGACARLGMPFESGPKPARFDPLLLRAGAPDASIGLGDIGTRADYGAGTGWRRASRFVPTLRLGKPVVVGALDQAIVRRFIKRNAARLSACYERELAAKPELAGEVKTSFVITAIGAVQEVTAEGVDPKVAGCVRGVLASIAFPQPRNGGVVKVQYPLVFQPPAVLPDVPADATPYVPGDLNPLRGHAPAVLACLHHAYGVGLVDFDAQVAVRGVAPDEAACIAQVAKQVTTAAGQTCAFAFGTMPVDALPAVDLDIDVRWNGTRVADLAAVAGAATVQPLVAAIRATPRADVPIRGPVLVRAKPATPMAVVLPVVMSIYAAGAADALIAIEGPAGWQLPLSIELPVVPVPVGTGAAWTGAAGALRITLGRDHADVGGHRVKRAEVAAELTKRAPAAVVIAADPGLTLQDVLAVAAVARVPWRLGN